MLKSTGGNAQAFIHYDPIRSDFSVSEDELNRLCDLGNSNHKDFFLVSISLSIPCLINAIATTPEPFVLSIGLFLNYLIGAVGFFFSIFFGLGWLKDTKTKNDLITTIRNKPIMPIAFTETENTSVRVQTMSPEEEDYLLNR